MIFGTLAYISTIVRTIYYRASLVQRPLNKAQPTFPSQASLFLTSSGFIHTYPVRIGAAGTFMTSGTSAFPPEIFLMALSLCLLPVIITKYKKLKYYSLDDIASFVL